jgi:hypothetical protein
MQSMARRVYRQCAGRIPLLGAAVFLLIATAPAAAEYHEIDEIRPFSLTDVDGYVRVGYLFDERDRGSVDTDTAQSQVSWEEEIFLRTRSFVYHPGFLNMVIGGGPVFVQQQFDDSLGAASNRETLLNFESRLNFLDIKNYPFSLYFEQRHPSVTRGLAGRFIVQRRIYGFRGALNQIVTDPTSVTVELKRTTAEGSGFGFSVDDDTEQATFTAQTSYRGGDRILFTYDRLDLESASGSPGLPIHISTQQHEISQLRFENRFGDRDQVDVFQLLSRQIRDLANGSTSTLDDRRYRGKLTWRHNEKTRSTYSYNYSDLERSSSASQLQDANVFLTRQLSENASIDAGLEHFSQDETGFSREENAFRGRATYTRDIKIGALTLGAGLRKARTDQESSASDIAVFDEAIVLVGTTPVDLAQEFVVPGSIVVRNFTNTQIYVEGSDYRVIQTGSVTSIQRLIDGNITDGETVLVDYRYQTSGTANFDTLDSNVVASVNLLQFLSAYARYSISDTDIRSGELTNRVNNRDRREFGLDLQDTALDGWSLGGHYRHVQQDEDLSPFSSNALSVNLSRSFWGRLSMSVSAGVTRTDYEFSDEDVDQRTYTLGLGGSPIRRTSVNYFASYLEDVGGTVPRTQVRHQLNFRWAYRMMRIMLLAEYSDDELGTTARTDNRVTLQIFRDF